MGIALGGIWVKGRAPIDAGTLCSVGGGFPLLFFLSFSSPLVLRERIGPRRQRGVAEWAAVGIGGHVHAFGASRVVYEAGIFLFFFLCPHPGLG